MNAAFDFSFEVVGAADVALRSLMLEPFGDASGPPVPLVCQLENWVPFLRMGQNALTDHDDVLVIKGPPGYALFGPYWTIPPGCYELIAAIFPPVPEFGDTANIKIDVATAYGELLLAVCSWRLGQYRRRDTKSPIELRLPFTVAEGLASVLPIETRLYTEGDSNCRIRSLAVRVRTGGLEYDLFPYLVIGECGIHADGEIMCTGSEIGCIAYTPPMDLQTGHYGLFFDFVDADANGAKPLSEPCMAIEVLSESEILAIRTCERGANFGAEPVLTFDIPEGTGFGTGMELFITAMVPARISIRGLRVKRLAKSKAPGRAPAALSAKELAYFDAGTASLGAKGGVLARPGKVAHIGYIQRPFRPGRYEAILTVARAGANGSPVGEMTIKGGGKRLGIYPIEFAPRKFGPMRIPRGPFRIFTFEVPTELPRGVSGIQIRIESTGADPFRVRSIAVKSKTPARELRDKAYATASMSLKRI